MTKENKGKILASLTKGNQKITTSSASHHTFFYHYNAIADMGTTKMTLPLS